MDSRCTPNAERMFTKIVSNVAIIHINLGTFYLIGYVVFSLNQANYCISINYIGLVEYTQLVIAENSFLVIFYTHAGVYKSFSNFCLFQYVKKHTGSSISNTSAQQINYSDYSIVIQRNSGEAVSNRRFTTSHCDWGSDTMFARSDPQEINQQIVHYINNTMALKMSMPNDFCYCTDDQHYNCSIDELEPVYPGQTYRLNLIVKSDSDNMGAVIIIDDNHNRACKSHSIREEIHLFSNVCSKIEYNILYKDGNSCHIYLNGMLKTNHKITKSIINYDFIDVYHIKILSCPLGFALNQMLRICHCDPVLAITPDSCNIDTQTIPRSPNSWIIGKTNVNNSHTYQVSSHCPFDYCLPHSSHLNLSNPDSQCQFNRTGVLCGRCKEGLSTIFGTSQCKQCSNYYLCLLLPFFLAGIILVVFLLYSTSQLLMEV